MQVIGIEMGAKYLHVLIGNDKVIRYYDQQVVKVREVVIPVEGWIDDQGTVHLVYLKEVDDLIKSLEIVRQLRIDQLMNFAQSLEKVYETKILYKSNTGE